MRKIKTHFKHEVWIKGRASFTLCTFIMRRRTERTDPSANELDVKPMTPFGVIVSFFSNGKHWSKQQLLRFFAFDIFIHELESFAAKECAMVFQNQPCFNVIIGDDEIADICMYFQFQNIQMARTFKNVEIKIPSRMWKVIANSDIFTVDRWTQCIFKMRRIILKNSPSIKEWWSACINGMLSNIYQCSHDLNLPNVTSCYKSYICKSSYHCQTDKALYGGKLFEFCIICTGMDGRWRYILSFHWLGFLNVSHIW